MPEAFCRPVPISLMSVIVASHVHRSAVEAMKVSRDCTSVTPPRCGRCEGGFAATAYVTIAALRRPGREPRGRDGAPTGRSTDAVCDHRRWRETLLRGDGRGRPHRVRARVRGRPSFVGNADAPFRPALPLHHLRRARLSAVRRAGEAESYSQNRATDDILAVMDHLAIDKAHVVGLSMGGFASLHFGFRHPTRARSLVVAGVGYGAEKHEQAKFKAEVGIVARSLKEEGMAAFAENTPTVRPVFSSRTRIRAASQSSRRHWPSIRPSGSAKHPTRLPGRAAIALRPGRQDACPDRPDACADRRRGLAVPRAVDA